jgi:hypothetical protein
MTISVFILRKWKCVSIFGNKDETTGAGSSVLVEYEKVLLLSFLGKNVKVSPFSKKVKHYNGYNVVVKSDYNSTISSMYCIGPSVFMS